MDKFFWFSLPITLMMVYLLLRAVIGKPVSRRDINMIAAIYLMFYLLITAGLGLFWVARMDLPAFDLHYLFGYCLLFLVAVHLWFQLPLVFTWLRRNSPSFLLDESGNQWKPLVRNIFLVVITMIMFFAITIIVYEFISPASVTIIENKPAVSAGNRLLLLHKGEKVAAASYIHQQGDITRGGAFVPRFNIAKPPLFKSYPGYPVVPLPVPASYSGVSFAQALSRNASQPVADMTLQTLSNLLYYSSGVTETRHYPGGQLQLRAAASAGALYPNDLYVAVIAIKGIIPGIYYYHPADHSLIRVGGQGLFQSLAAASPYPDMLNHASAMIMITAYFDRSIWKYHERSYRYVLPDAGHILGNLTAVAAAMSLPYSTTAFFDDEKMEQILGLAQQDEGVLSMVVLGKNQLTSLTQIPQFGAVSQSKDAGELEITRLSHKLTSLKWVTGSMTAPIMNVDAPGDPVPSVETLTQLPEGSSTEEDLFTTIKNRRSFRQFSHREISLEDFSGIIHDAYKPLANPHIVANGKRVELFIVITRVHHLAKGIYRYIPEKSALQKIADGDFSNKIYQAGLSQEVLKRAAFVMVWVVDLDRVGLLHGERDYRYANLECGIGGEIAYLAAQARGLGACAVGAFYDDEVQAILKIQGTAKRAILFTAVGQKTA